MIIMMMMMMVMMMMMMMMVMMMMMMMMMVMMMMMMSVFSFRGLHACVPGGPIIVGCETIEVEVLGVRISQERPFLTNRGRKRERGRKFWRNSMHNDEHKS